MPEERNAAGPRTLLIWAGALIVALWLGLTAAGAVTQEAHPNAALALFPKNGFAYQNRAMAAAIGKTESIRDLRVGPESVADARAALRREPLASTALTLIGLAREASGERAQAAKIVIAAHTLDRRQLVANGWLINHYGTQPGDHSDEVLGLLDEALKIRPELTQQYMPALSQALVNADTIPVFQRLLRGKPSWEENFWLAVASNDAALPNAEVLRSRMLGRRGEPGEADALLMRAFIRARRMDLALSYAKSLPTLSDDHENLLRNASFGMMPKMPPLDWELMNDGRIGSAIDEGRGTLIVNAIAGSGGTVARQLVALPPGEYMLLVKLGSAQFTRGSDLRVQIDCAESGGQAIPLLTEKVESDVERTFALANDTSCRFYWVNLIFSAIDSSMPASTSIAEVRIVRARARQETQAPAEETDGNLSE